MKLKEIFTLAIITTILIFGGAYNFAIAETQVERMPNDSYPEPPEAEVTMDWQLPDVKASCYENGEYSQTCPVLNSDEFTFWAFSYKDNRVGLMIVKYDKSGNVIEKWEKDGARYLYDISVDAEHKTVSFWGQSDSSISMSWDELGITSGTTIEPPVIEPVLPPTEPEPPVSKPNPSEKIEKIPAWIKDVFAFYVDGSIDEGALINALQWLIKEGIINIE